MSERHYRIVRWCLGSYLLIHFLTLMPHAVELFSDQGALSDPAQLPSYGFFPNPLFVFSSPSQVGVYLGLLCFIAILFTAGIWTRITAGALWFGWASLVSRNPFISNPSIPCIGLLLLFFALVSSAKKDAQRFAWQGIWALMAVAYTVSGLHKLGSLSWVDGSALAELLRNPLARSNIFTHLLAQSPPMLLAVMTWSALALEILFAPLALFVTSRFYVWLSMVLMHLGILMVVAFADLTIGMLILHLFTFDPRWLRPKALLPGQPHPVFFYDGSCGMCNQFVQRVLKYDTTERFSFAPLQGDYARKMLPPEFVKTMNTLVLQDEYETIHVRSNAFLEICKGIGGAWSLFGILRLVPRAIRDWGYDIIATYRHRLFPAHDVCRMLTPEERTRFM